ncbi:unnamed protein product [Acanthoscelides obtectus]|uniref:Uncharacterized protein n=1 Tax=Acanthoscelides obtectus TaxID=200917 RepID=A0A9P0KEK9_ACAOB|nr:unnamed protein product [Acanthoscelides obtectus]CAK1646775.1 hypothetical protein AOBTE_LOCUS14860 [Acanthoscelides obtectus]
MLRIFLAVTLLLAVCWDSWSTPIIKGRKFMDLPESCGEGTRFAHGGSCLTPFHMGVRNRTGLSVSFGGHNGTTLNTTRHNASSVHIGGTDRVAANHQAMYNVTSSNFDCGTHHRTAVNHSRLVVCFHKLSPHISKI